MSYRMVLLTLAAAALVACGQKKPEEVPDPEPELTPETYYGSGQYSERTITNIVYEWGSTNTTTSTTRYLYFYDASGRMAKVESYDSGTLSRISTYEYEGKTRKQSHFIVYNGGQTLSEIIETTFIDDDMTMYSDERYTFPDRPASDHRTERDWSNGRLIRQREYSTTSKLVEYLSAEITYTYEETGLVVVKKQHTERYNAYGSIVLKGDGMMTYTYKDAAKKYLLSYATTYSKSEYSYNEDNLLTTVKEFDPEDGVPFSITEYSYSGNTKTEHYSSVSVSDRSKLSSENIVVYKYLGDPLDYEYHSDNSKTFLFPETN